jgi:hypothetical protein
MREYRHFQRIRTRQEIVRRVVIVMLVVIVAGAILLALRGAAQAQTNIGEPWCQISAPSLPTLRGHLPAHVELNCIQPRVFVPLAMKAR